MYQTSLYWPSTRGLRGPFWRQFIWLIQATNVVFAEEGEQVNKLGNFGQTTFYWRLTFSFLSMGKVKICMFRFFLKVFLSRNLWKTGVMALFMIFHGTDNRWFRWWLVIFTFDRDSPVVCNCTKDATLLTDSKLQVSFTGQFSTQLSGPLYLWQCLDGTELHRLIFSIVWIF